MMKYIQQNRQVLVAAVTLFMLSMSTLMFFLGSDEELKKQDYKADIIDLHGTVTSISEKKYRDLIHNQKDPFVVLQFNGNIEFMSKDFENISGFPQQEMVGKLFFLQVNPEDFSLFLEALTKVAQTGEPQLMVGPYRLRNLQGDYHVHMGSIIPVVKEGHTEQFILTTREIDLPQNHSQSEEKEEEEKEHKSYPGKKIRDEENKPEPLVADKLAAMTQKP